MLTTRISNIFLPLSSHGKLPVFTNQNHDVIVQRIALARPGSLYSRDIIDIRLNQASVPSLRASANLRAAVTTLLPKMISTGQESSIVPARRESRSRKSFSAKHPRLILLQGAQNKLSGMILLRETTAPASRASIVSRGNYLRICMFREMSVQERRACKSFRMISLQNSKNKPFGMILLRKKVGGRGGWRTSRAKLSPPRTSRRERPPRTSWRSGASRRSQRHQELRGVNSSRESHGHQELSRVNKVG